MELKEEEAQVCRLCGQRESIYIDVFGEEGTKRLLGLKIHSKINILIQKDDGLPQVVCVRCLGTLEFLCDFYDLCHHTQNKLTNKIETVKDVINVVHMENDAEFDKENAFPSPRKCHQSGSYKNRSKSELDQSNVCSVENLNNFVTAKQSNIKETELNDKRNCSNVTKLEKSFSSKEEPFIKISQISSTNVKIDKSKLSNQSEKKNRTRKATLRETRSEDNKTHSSLIKKTRRKSSVHKSLIDSFNLKRFNNVKESRVILSHDDTNTTKADILFISNTKDASKEFSINENQSIVHLNKTEEILSNKIHDNNKNNVDNNNMHEKKKNNLSKKVKCHSNENNIKNENSDHIIPHKVQVLQSNQFVWASNDTLLQEPYKPKSEKDETVLNTSPQPGDEAESNQQVDANSIVNHIHISEVVPISKSVRNKCLAEQVSSSSLDVPNEVQLSRKKIQHNCEKDITPGTSQQLEFKNNLNERLRRNGKFGKISELISHEQKIEIEKYYKIDMSVVDSSIVEKNLTITDKRTIQCNICGLMYPRLDKCQVHVWAHLKMRPYKCTACEFSTVTISNVRCHIRKRHLKIKPFACHLCEKRYVTAVLLEEHLNTHTGARPFKCKICDFASCSRQVLSYHNTTHKPVKDIHCNVCGKEFYSRGRMRAHMLIHNKDKVVMCKLCSAYLSNETALEQHMKNIHTRDYICNICGKILKSRKTLLNHKNVHAAAKYKCDLCPNVYKSSHILKEHLLKHEGIRKYKCNNCEKSFAQQSHLAAHMAVHSEIRYHCPGCNKAFNRRDNMKIHTKRCKSFLANPELKDLLKNKGRTKYIRKINDHVTLDTSMNTNKETFTNTDKETSRNTDNESNKLLILKYEETANNVISKDINKENDSNNQQNISQYVYNENVQNNETIRSLEKMIELSGSSTENTYDIIPENSTVIQNVLHSDCF
ncbi:zinc finger protein 665-like isoform X1 [Vespa crabro]|uniref:zinc finger protein 665-like isoform X1 n=1 Tax=Vespa crabro TaxID=7445 RepID=UPI001F0238A8|nr:zinc finger protein 665-like isoform X1 [Vespa crabro]